MPDKLGELLIKKNLLTQAQLEEARNENHQLKEELRIKDTAPPQARTAREKGHRSSEQPLRARKNSMDPYRSTWCGAMG